MTEPRRSITRPGRDAASTVSASTESRAATGIAAAALIIMVGNVLSRLLGLAREQLASDLFGTGDPIAAFTVADNVHTLLFDLMASGMLEAALIPVLAGWAAPDLATRRELRRVAGALLTLVCVVVGAAALLGIAFAPTVVHVMTALAGQTDVHDPTTVALTVTLVRWILPAVLLLSIGTVLMATLYAISHVTAPALAPAARNAAIVAAMLFFSGALGVKSLAVGVVAGAVLIVIVQLAALRRAGAVPRPNLDFRHPSVRTVLVLYLPIFLGLLVNTTAVVIDRNLAWRAGRDAIGAMRYATTLVQLVLGLVAAAISLAALPTLTRHYQARDEDAFRATLAQALSMVTVLILPAIFGLAAVARPVVDLLFRHGATGESGSRQIVVALLGYLPGTLFAAFDQVLIFAFYARRNTRLPVLVGMLSVAIYFVVALSLAPPLGMLGLVLANSTQFIVHALVMWMLVRRRIGQVGKDHLSRVAGRCLGAAAGMGLAAFVVAWAMARWLPPPAGDWSSFLREASVAGVPIALGAGIYILALHLLGVEELAVVRSVLLGKVLPRFAG